MSDLGRATTDFADHLGLVVDGPEVLLPSQGTVVQFLRPVDADRSGAAIELIAPEDPDDGTHPLVRFMRRGGSRVHHVCFVTGDIDGELARLGAGGVLLVDKKPWLSPHGWAAFVHPANMHGVAIELRQYL